MGNHHHPHRDRLRGRGYFNRLGPGLVTGAADDDPSGIGTYAQVGASTGFGMLWTAPVLLPFAIAVQETCARLALANRAGLARIIKRNFPRPLVILAVGLIVFANTVNIAADLASMAAAVRLVVPVPQFVGVVAFTLILAVSEILIPYHRYAKVLRWLCLSLLAYVAVLFAIDVPWSEVWGSLLHPSPSWNRTSIAAVIALAGTTISPYLFVWQAAEEVEDLHSGVSPVSRAHVRSMRVDVASGMTTGVIIMFAIMTTTGTELFAHGITSIASAEAAADALRPLAGEFAGLVFALGIIGTGLLAVPVLAGASAYAVAELMGWPESLERRPARAKAFYGVIVVSMLAALLLNLLDVNPMYGLFLAAVTNGLAAPLLLLLIAILARRHRVMHSLRSGWLSQALVFGAVLLMSALPVAYLVVGS